MKKIKEIITVIKSNLALMSGIGLLVYSVFNFQNDKYCKGSSLPGMPSGCNNSATYYYYDNLTLILLIVGAILLTVGLLKLKK